ncbi:MAG: hypothetical protein HY928_15820 [Elusimicrobia bacterium]|nr:hypothetical protein [Elusimicrobiota bacterium]
MKKAATTERNYENIFCIFMAGLAFLARSNSDLVFPDVLYLFVLLLGLNLAAAVALRRFPAQDWMSALLTMANTAVVAGIVEKSGAEHSVLWVLYLLPVYSSGLLLGERNLWLVTAGASLFNSVPLALTSELGRSEFLLFAGTRGGIILMAAGVLARAMRRERKAREAVMRKRGELAMMESTLQAKTVKESAPALNGGTLDAAGILHDARTPLTIIQTSAEMAAEAGGTEFLNEHLERIRRSARLCEHILVQALEQVRTSPAVFSPESLNGIIRASEQLCRAETRLRGIKVDLRLSKELPSVMVDSMAMERVFLNLIKNAVEALGRKGTLTLTTMLVCAPDGSPLSVRATVEDDGPGLPADLLNGGFAAGKTTKSKGFGLGLETSRRIVLRHGGSFWAENRPEGGARFVIDIPGAVLSGVKG